MNPLSSIFGAGAGVRNLLYDRGIIKVRKLERPVISVGNISVGGSGKTPFVIALGGLLKQRGISFDVISRGYGRSSFEIAVADPSGSPEQFGDEPLLIARKLQVPVIVGVDRYQAGLMAEKTFPSTLHLLDDGFQHRRLHRDFDIVLLPAEDQKGVLLPVGRLREPPSALQRADAVVQFDSPKDEFEFKNIWRARREVEFSGIGGKLIAFCGIGRPQQFFDALQTTGQEIADTVVYRDHHRYSRRDIDRLIQLKKNSGADGFITTEKDAVNLASFSRDLQPLQIVGLRIVLESSERLVAEILTTLEKRTGCRF